MRKRFAIAAGSVAALTLLALGIRDGLPGPAEEPGVVPGSIAILPFDEQGDLEEPLRGAQLAQLLSNMMQATDRYRPALSSAVQGKVVTLCEEPSALCGARVASALDTQYYLFGRITALRNDSVRVDAYMVDATGEREIAPVTITNSRAAPYAVLDSLTARLWVANATEGERVVSLAGVTTGSMDALRHFLDGERHLANWVLDSALSSFERASEIDSSFALAWYRLAVIYDWNNWTDLAMEAAARAEEFADRLPVHDRRMLIAHRAQVRGDPLVAEPIYLGLLEDDPNDVEALMQLGYLYWAYNWRLGRSMAEAVEPLRHAMRLTDNALAAPYLGWALLAGPEPDSTRLAEIETLHPGRPPLAAIRAIKQGDSIGLAAALDSIMLDHPWGVINASLPFMYLGTQSGDVPDLAMHIGVVQSVSDSSFLDRYFEHNRETQEDWQGDKSAFVNWLRVIGYTRIAELEVGRGRWSAARAAIATSNALGNQRATLGFLATLPLADPLPVDAESLREELDAWVAGGTGRNQYRSLVRLYLSGLLSALDGDYEGARASARQLEAHQPDEALPTLHRDLASGVLAEMLLRQGKPEEALTALEQAPRRVSQTSAFRSRFAGGEREVFLRARALQLLDRNDEAIQWYAAVAERSPALLAPTHYYRGEAYEALGDSERAIWHYSAFLDLWQDADPEYQSRVTDARQRVARLAVR